MYPLRCDNRWSSCFSCFSRFSLDRSDVFSADVPRCLPRRQRVSRQALSGAVNAKPAPPPTPGPCSEGVLFIPSRFCFRFAEIVGGKRKKDQELLLRAGTANMRVMYGWFWQKNWKDLRLDVTAAKLRRHVLWQLASDCIATEIRPFIYLM